MTVSGIVGCVSERKDEGHEQPVVLVQEGPSACDLRLWGDYHHPVGSYLPSGGDDVQGQVLGCTVLGACPPKALYVKKSYKMKCSFFLLVHYWGRLWGV